jgi:hypothetical protein
LAAPVAELPKTTDNPKPAENNAAAAAAVSETPVAAAKNPASVADAVAILPVAGTAPQILLPTPRDTGLAAFRAGPDILIVLDTPIPFQPPSAPAGAPANASLDPAFASLTSTRTQDATVLRLKLAAPNGVRLERDERGWVVTLDQPPDNIAHIVPRLVASGATLSLRLPASAPSRVVTVADPRTGENLLVGTQGSAGEAVDEARQQIQFSLPRTLQGVVVAPKSDDLALRPDAAGFVLTAGPHAGGSLAVANDDVPSGENESGETQSADSKSGVLADAAPRSRLFDLPDDPPEILARRLAGQIAAAAAAPALSRAAPRLRVATTMLALGMGVEAQSVIDIATEADPALADDPKVIGLRAAAEILAGRPDAAATLADPRLGGTTEVLLWRALLRLARGPAGPRDGNDLAAALPLLLAYPPTLRQRLLPTALETIALTGAPTGQAAARSALANFPDDPSLDLARAMMLEATNQPDAALARYDAVAGRGDRLPRYTALVRAAELRLKLGKLDARTAADALDKALFGWRAPAREQGLRLRIAALRRQAGQWDAALDVLRDGRAAFPDDPAAIDRGIAETFAALFSGDAARHLAPGDFVALYDKNADLAAAMTWPESLGMKLVDRLVERGLQGRAAPVLARLEEAATDPPRRAVLGARLAALRLTLDDPAGALAALADSVPPVGAALNTIDPAVLRARQFLYARAEAGRGHADAALAMFAALDTADADEARADIFAARGDWPRGLAALAAVERKRIPATATPPDTLTDSQQALVLRLAQAATLAGDGATLSRLGAIYGAAMAQGGGAAPFRLLISAPVRSSTDLPRAYEEIQLARKLPANLATR